MVSVKLGNKIFEDVKSIKLNTTDGGTVMFEETDGGLPDNPAFITAGSYIVTGFETACSITTDGSTIAMYESEEDS